MRPLAALRAFRRAFSLAAQNQKLRKQNELQARTLARVLQERDYWVHYQQQTATESKNAQEIMVREIDNLRRRLGADPDGKWLDFIHRFSRARIEGEQGMHPYAETYAHIGKNPITAVSEDLLVPIRPTRS